MTEPEALRRRDVKKLLKDLKAQSEPNGEPLTGERAMLTIQSVRVIKELIRVIEQARRCHCGRPLTVCPSCAVEDYLVSQHG